MKRKTSVNIDDKFLRLIKLEAKRQDRSVSYILSKFLEEKARQLQQFGAIKKRRRSAGKIIWLSDYT